MDALHPSDGDLLDVLLLYPHVGAFDGHRDATVQGPEARDDLQTEGGGGDRYYYEIG